MHELAGDGSYTDQFISDHIVGVCPLRKRPALKYTCLIADHKLVLEVDLVVPEKSSLFAGGGDEHVSSQFPIPILPSDPSREYCSYTSYSIK